MITIRTVRTTAFSIGICCFSMAAMVHAEMAMEEIIVTAQKRSDSVQEVPVSLSVVSSRDLDERGIRDPDDLMYLVPSMQVGRQNGYTMITIRGIGRNEGTPGVAVHTDGVYQPRAEMADLAQLDLERVEVLRGPQGTVYGRNANGGVINFVTASPTEEFGGRIRAGYASYDESRLQGVINVPISDNMRTRLTVDWIDRNEGFVENVGTGPDLFDEESLNARLRIVGELSETFSYDLSLSIARQSGALVYHEVLDGPAPASLAAFPALATGNYVTEPHKTSINGPVDHDRDYDAFSATLTWDISDNVQLKSISSYADFEDNELKDDDAIDLDIFTGKRLAATKTKTQELNLLWSNDAQTLEGVFGVFYMEEDHENSLVYDNIATGYRFLPPNSQLGFLSPELVTESLSAFFDFTWSVSERLRLIAGLRYLDDSTEHTQSGYVSFGPAFVIPTCPLQTNDQDFTSTIPRAGVQYDIADNRTFYATYTEGFKSGGFNMFGCNGKFEPEEIDAYEAGLKSEFLDGSLVLNIAVFDYDYTNLQLRQIVGTNALITNAAGAEIQGLEIESRWQVTENFSLSAALAWLDAEYTDYQTADSLNPDLGVQDVTGNTLNSAPDFSLNLGLAYRSGPVIADGSITARLDASYRSDVYLREFNNPLDTQDSYTVLHAAVIWDSADERYQARLFADNLTDKEYIGFMAAADPQGSRIVNWGTPRQYGLEVTFNF